MEPKSRVESTFQLIWGVGVRLILLFVAVYFLWRVRSVVVAILLSAVLTYAVLPLVDFLCTYQVRGMRRKTQRFVATTLVFVLLVSLAIMFSVVFLTPFKAELSAVKGNMQELGDQIKSTLASGKQWYSTLPPDVQRFAEAQQFKDVVDRFVNWGGGVLGTTVDWLTRLHYIILIPVLAFYFTLDSRTLKREFVALAPRRARRKAFAILRQINCIMRSYVVGQIILCVIAGVVVWVLLSLAHMRYALILSVFAGIARAVPIIGPIVSGFVIVLLATIKSPVLGFDIFVVFALLHFVESKFIMPKLIGHRMELHPALIIIVLLIGAEFFGILGMFLAAPVASIVRILVRYYVIRPKELRVWGPSSAAPMPEPPEPLVRTEKP